MAMPGYLLEFKLDPPSGDKRTVVRKIERRYRDTAGGKLGRIDRQALAIRKRGGCYGTNHEHQLPRLISEYMTVDVAATTVSPMDESGYFTFGVANDLTSTAARCAEYLIIEVNENMPRIHGDSLLHSCTIIPLKRCMSYEACAFTRCCKRG